MATEPPVTDGNGNTPPTDSDIAPISIVEEMKTSYLDYAMSVIVSRALPDVRDGLKPVHRRILFSAYESGFFYNRGFRKSARIVGDVIGKYHPHGDSAIYDALARMTQNWSMRVPLIDGRNYDSYYVVAAGKKHFVLRDSEKTPLAPAASGNAGSSVAACSSACLSCAPVISTVMSEFS